jgi:hypothetical protein
VQFLAQQLRNAISQSLSEKSSLRH